MVTKVIDKFDGEYSFLSNFYDAPVMYEGLMYKNSESAYQSAKLEDKELRKQFCNLSGSTAKKLGRKVKLRSDWEDIKYEVMCDCLLDKFTRNEDLRQKLLDTKDAELIEGCRCDICLHSNKIEHNILGVLLMLIRAVLRNEVKYNAEENI